MRSLQLIWVDPKSTSILVRYTQRQQRVGGESHEKTEAEKLAEIDKRLTKVGSVMQT